ncbi:MAG: crossover junction endodeoxyribonuclease RuvC [Patescibacteria group bacterium]
MRILGIDPGIGITGWSIVQTTGNSTLLLEAAGIISTTPNSVTHHRLVTIYSQMTQLIQRFQPTELAIEKLFFAKNVTTAMAVSQARGVVLLAGAQSQLPIFEYTPLQVKMTITGYGKATKQQVNAMLSHHIKGATIPKQDDAADAIAIAITHLASAPFVRKQGGLCHS